MSPAHPCPPLPSPDDLLPISLVSSFLFCPRQAWLSRVEAARAPHAALEEGRVLHEEPDPQGSPEAQREVTVSSERYRLIGRADRVIWAEAGPFPIEIKRGARPGQREHHVQLALLALCLEEMTGQPVLRGEIHHGHARTAEPVAINGPLRAEALHALAHARRAFERVRAPAAQPSPACAGCSLNPLCLPTVTDGRGSARARLAQLLDG